MATEKGVIPVLDTGISFCKLLYYKEINYQVKPDNDIFELFQWSQKSRCLLIINFILVYLTGCKKFFNNLFRFHFFVKNLVKSITNQKFNSVFF